MAHPTPVHRKVGNFRKTIQKKLLESKVLIIDDDCKPYEVNDMFLEGVMNPPTEIFETLLKEFPDSHHMAFLPASQSLFATFGDAGTIVLDNSHKVHWVMSEVEALKIAYRFITHVIRANPKAFSLEWLLQYLDVNRFINSLHEKGLEKILTSREQIVDYLRDEDLSDEDIINTIAPEFIDILAAADGGVIECGWEYFFGLDDGSYNICEDSDVIYFYYVDKEEL